MSKGIYIGNENAKKVKRIYLGDSNSRKVKKGYVGVNNQAKLFYSSGYTWNKYNTTIEQRHRRNQNGGLDSDDCNETDTVYIWEWNSFEELVSSVKLREKQSGGIFGYTSNIILPHYTRSISASDDTTIAHVDRGTYMYFTIRDKLPSTVYAPYVYTRYPSGTETYGTSYILNYYDDDVGCWDIRLSGYAVASSYYLNPVKGELIGTVDSDNRNEYPDNDYEYDTKTETGYWYAYQGEA